MSLFLWLLLGIILIAGAYSYLFLIRFREIIGCHIGMNITMAVSVLGIATGIVLAYQFPSMYTVVTIINTLIAMIIGILFGALGDFQTVISGGISGMMAGIMGPMLGAMVDKPFLLLVFMTILSLFSFAIVCFSMSLEEGEQKGTSEEGMERGKD
jgi:MFS family permease